ncbi:MULTISPECIES: peptide ABC transporter substrate-binding protein [Clostridia]|nr:MULTISPECIES: peptide ABC transporter substrate-binding protein [Clostridia]
MKKKLVSLLAVLLCIAMVTGCGGGDDGDGSQSKIFRWARNYDATTLDTRSINDDGSYEVAILLVETLVRFKGGEIVPGVAKDWTVSDDGKEYTFNLREEATWSDGTPLTAEDFAYSFLNLITADNACGNADRGFIFKNGEEFFKGECKAEDVGVEAVDEHTLKVTFESSGLEKLYELSNYWFAPVKKDVVEEYGIEYGSEAEKFMGNGAFTVTSWEHGSKIILAKNENYWDKDSIKVDGMELTVDVEEKAAADMLSAGEVDAMVAFAYESVKDIEDGNIVIDPFTSGYQFVHMNSGGCTEESKRFMENTNFRRALNYAVNRKALVDSIYAGAAEPATRITAPDALGVEKTFNEEYPFEAWPAEGNPEKAKECLEAALKELGASIDDVPELTMVCYESQNSTMALQAVQDMILSTLNIKCSLNPLPIQQMLSKVDNGEWDIWWGGKTLGTLDWASTDSIADAYDFGSSQCFGYKNEDFSKTYKEAKGAETLKERKDLLFDMEKIACDDPASILAYWSKSFCAHTKNVKGITYGNYIDATYVELTE